VERRAAEPPLIDAVLRPGDCLYLPRGFLHAANALGGVSIHLTIGVHVWTRYAVAERLVQQAMRILAGDPEARSTLPLGVDFTGAALDPDVDSVKRSLLAAVEAVDPAVIASGLQSLVRGASRAAPIGPLAQFRAAERLDSGSVIALRAHLAPSLDRLPDGGAVLHSRADDVRLAPDELPVMESLLVRGLMSAGIVGVELSRHLVLAGVAVVVDAAPE
jgi:hypothetical protein